MPKGNFEGLLVPALTPLAADLSPDGERFVRFCRWLLDEGANGLAVFGTTSEANSIPLDQRQALLATLIESGIPATRLMPGIGACALEDAVRLARLAVEAGCGGVLALPPFYYKNVSDDGLYAYYAELVERVGDPALKIYIYHIPPQSMVPLGIDLIGRLIAAFPETIVGLKDSGGDWSYTQSLLREFPGFDVFPGSEAFLLQGLRAGTRGCISATANINAAAIRRLIDTWRTDDDAADAQQARLTELRQAVQAFPVIPAVKAIVAHFHDAPEWRTVKPPLTPLGEGDTRELLGNLARLDFAMAPPGAAQVV
jgi:4-hydroxy-tetrahydrodipicolinate synthase